MTLRLPSPDDLAVGGGDAMAEPTEAPTPRRRAGKPLSVEQLRLVGKKQIRFPDLREYLARWHGGKPHRSGVLCAWSALSLKERTTMHEITTEALAEDTDVAELQLDLEGRMENYTAGIEGFATASFIIECWFLHEESGVQCKEEWYGTLTLPQETPQFGMSSTIRGGTTQQQSTPSMWTALALQDKNRTLELCMQKDEAITRTILSVLEKVMAMNARLEAQRDAMLTREQAALDQTAERELRASRAKMRGDMERAVFENLGGVVKQAIPTLTFAAKDWLSAQTGGPKRPPTSREEEALTVLREMVTKMRAGMASQGLSDDQQAIELNKFLDQMGVSASAKESLLRFALEFSLEEQVVRGGPGIAAGSLGVGALVPTFSGASGKEG